MKKQTSAQPKISIVQKNTSWSLEDREKYESVRKWWLRSFYMCLALFFLVLALVFFHTYFIEKDLWGAVAGTLFLGFLGIIPWAIARICAYEGRGTKWLLFLIIAIPFQLLSLLSSSRIQREPFLLSLAETSIAMLSRLFFFLALGFYWIQCIRLYIANRDYKKAHL